MKHLRSPLLILILLVVLFSTCKKTEYVNRIIDPTDTTIWIRHDAFTLDNLKLLNVLIKNFKSFIDNNITK